MLLIGVVGFIICYFCVPPLRNALLGIQLVCFVILLSGAMGEPSRDVDPVALLVCLAVGCAIGYAGRWINKNQLDMPIK